MSPKLNSSVQVWKLASDLGLKPCEDTVGAVLRYVLANVRKVAKKFSCASLKDLLIATAAEVKTVFREVHSDTDLRQLQKEYSQRGETGFANLERDLQDAGDFAITLKLLHPREWEPLFVSIVDCRGDKIFRRYFSMWHELAHLLTLTSQRRLVFRRTHAAIEARDPEEILMDVIASNAGFLADFMPEQARGTISFEKIDIVREEFCPDASHQASLIGIVKSWPEPCILVEAQLALRKRDADALRQATLAFAAMPPPTPQLRVVHVTVNNAARRADIQFFNKWRVPKSSAIYKVFADGGYMEAEENLASWMTSDGTGLDNCDVIVKARRVGSRVIALIVPQI